MPLTWAVSVLPTDLAGVAPGVDLHGVQITFSPSSTGGGDPNVTWEIECSAPVPIHALNENSPSGENGTAIHDRVGHVGNLKYGSTAGQINLAVWPAGSTLTVTATTTDPVFSSDPTFTVTAFSFAASGPMQTLTVGSTTGGTAGRWARTGALRLTSLPGATQFALTYDELRTEPIGATLQDQRLVKRPDRANPNPQDWLIVERRDTIGSSNIPGIALPPAGLTMVASPAAGPGNQQTTYPCTITATAASGVLSGNSAWNGASYAWEPYTFRWDPLAVSPILRTVFTWGARPGATFGGLQLALLSDRQSTRRGLRVPKAPYAIDRIPGAWTPRAGTFDLEPIPTGWYVDNIALPSA